MEENKALTDPREEPNDFILEEILGKKFKVYQEFAAKLDEQNLVLEWNYYRDTKSWLCKVLHKKKNMCWLSIWNTGFYLTFYFPEKFFDAVFKLDIDDEIKKLAAEMKPAGKSHPVKILIKNKKRMNDGITIIEYKMGCKG